MQNVEPVCRLLESLGASYALIGGRAVGARGFPRMTPDYDFLTTDRRVLQPQTWKAVRDLGAVIDLREGDADDPLGGVVRVALPNGAEADVVVAKWKWEQGVIERAERLDIGGLEMPVARTSDLILLKLAAGGVLDLQDVVVLLAVSGGEEIVREVEERLGDLPLAATEAWRRIRLPP